MQQIADWLEKLGMSEYKRLFAENRIDFSVLPDLTDQHLKDLGLPLGDRLKMLRAIQKLSDTVSELPQGESRSYDAAERRQVTVMFSDLVGSTALSARMDPEDLREVISAYQKCVADAVQLFGGFVAKYMGDGALVYFGYPQANEDDAERAVRAGLELVAAISDLKTHAPLQTRVGIATGLVVVGDLIGSGASQEQAIVGETPNLAARLQAIAEPNTVVIAESTRKLVGNLFELEDLGARDLKGIAGPVRAWAALRPSSVESRFEALHASGVTELIGREEELEILLRRWSKTKSDHGQVVLLSGEPGIGKSRLTAALLERLASEPHSRLRYFCSPQRTDSAFFPIISQMERAAGFTHSDTGQVKLDKLDAILTSASISKQDAAFLADLLSLPNDGRYPALELTPQQRRERTLGALLGQIETLARNNPLLVTFEDAHWADPTSLEAFGRAVDRIAALRVMLLITFRPEFEPPWIGQPHVTSLTLSRLTRREVEAMIDRVVGNKALPASIQQDIIDRTDGIPLFVEEMTKAVLEAESLGAAAEAIAMVPRPVLAVPASLHASLIARLDRLGGPAKEVAQIGAVIGREFSHALLAAVMRKPEVELRSALDRVVAAGLLFQQGVPPNATYLFKHALILDVAYGTLLREPRRALHARIADTLERQFTEIAENQPELLARHCTEAGLSEKAAGLWGRAGLRSLERSALVEASEQLTRALDQMATLASTRALRNEQVKLQVALTTSLMYIRGFAALETRAAARKARLLIEQAEALGEPLEDPLLLLSVLYSFGTANILAFKADICCTFAADFLALAEKSGTPVALMFGHDLMGASLLWAGDIAGSREHYSQALALYDPVEHRPLTTRFGHDVGLIMLSVRSIATWVLGYPEAALADIDKAVIAARQTGHAATLGFVLSFACLAYLSRGDCVTAKAFADELVTLGGEKELLFGKIVSGWSQGCIAALTGKYPAAVEFITSALAAWRLTGASLYGPSWLSVLASARAELGQYDEAWRCIEEALTEIETSKERWSEAEVNRIAGEIALKSPGANAAKAVAHFERALSVARQQQAKSWELRGAMSLARLWRDQGKVQQARELLAPVYGWFTDGFDTSDLKDAKALLGELAS
jgi:class 3 adenylate cyclase/predicted ATPase